MTVIRAIGAKMSKERDIAFGKHSKIPACCIQFFVDEWEQEYSRKTWYYEAVQRSIFNYVPCPTCFAHGNRVAIVICEVDCGRECWREYAN